MNDSRTNVHYEVDVECEDFYPHDGCDSICRCRTISSASVRDVSFMSLTGRFFKAKKYTNPFMFYAVERILRAYFRPDTYDDFDVQWGGGYYGDEVHAVYMPISTTLREAFARLVEPYPRRLPVADREQYLARRCITESLVAEYGHVLPQLVGKTWTIETVKRDKIGVPGQLQPLNRKLVDSYRGSRWYYEREKVPYGVALASGSGFDLIDGRHRYAATEGIKSLPLIVGR